MPEVKDKETTLKVATEKQLVTYKGAPIRLSADFFKNFAARRDWQEIFKVMKSNYLQPILPSKAIIQNQSTNKELPRQEKAKGVHHHQTIII